MSWFVAGTGTEVGKTFVTAALVQALGAPWRALKPVASGLADPVESDAARLARAQGGEASALSLYALQASLAPDRAAAAEGVTLDWSAIVDFCRGESLLIEGAGGLYSPLTDTRTNADLAQALSLPILLVAATSLGTLSHSIATLRAARADGLDVQGIIFSQGPAMPGPEELPESLRRLLPETPPVFILPRQTEAYAAGPALRQWLGEIRRPR